MRNNVKIALSKLGFEVIRNIKAKNMEILAIPSDYHEDVEVFYDRVIQSEIERPHYYGVCLELTGDSEHCIIAIVKHDDQKTELFKKVHFREEETPLRFRQKINRVKNLYKQSLSK